MEFKAELKHLHIAPRKVRIITDALKRYKRLSSAVQVLHNINRRGAEPLEKLLLSAGANARHTARVPLEALKIKTLQVNDGPKMKRFRPRERGRATPYWKRTSHVRIIIESDAKFTPVSESDMKNARKEKIETKREYSTKMSDEKNKAQTPLVKNVAGATRKVIP